ncbi:hypothetical protein DCC62_09295 [candidate division KSB1 bacterium]|nr:MAG: hypothetical protein DCC62_09295 [candidate division KSB1 bacterium]
MPLTADDIRNMIAAGEGQTLEFKRDVSQRSDTAGELIAFANTGGGHLLVGVTDDGQIVGVSDPDAVMNTLANISRDNCQPFDETPVAGTTLADVDHEAFQKYFEKISRQPIAAAGISVELLLEHTRVATTVNETQRLTVAGLLIFGREPQRYMPQSRISAVRFLGNDSTADRLHPQEMAGTLPQLVNQCGDYVKLYNGVYTQIDGFVRREQPFCPPDVVREVVVNAVAHRDYSIAGSQIRLFFFDNHLEVRSPGRLPNSMTLESIRFYNYESRNPLLAQFLNRLGFMEEFGSGIPNMIRQMRAHNGTEPEFALEGEEFVVRLFANGRRSGN